MEPTTELDKGFSDADATATDWNDVRRELTSAQQFWVTTVRTDGRPHTTPLVAVWLDDAVYFCTGATEQKAVNLRSNHNVILMTGSNRWNEGIDVIVEGVAERVTDDATLRRLADEWRTKWDGQWQFDVVDGHFFDSHEHIEALVVGVKPTKVLSFAKAPFAATRHRF